MVKELQNKKNNFQFTTEDYILYILSKLPNEKSTPLYLNKVAFLTEFAYKFKTFSDLSDAQYAAINLGPVINDYNRILDKMHDSEKLERVGRKQLFPKQQPGFTIPEEIKLIIDPLIEHYSHMSIGELIKLTHETDSYTITTNGGKVMSKIIDKDLTHLDMIFAGDQIEEIPEIDEDKLPVFKRDELIKYDFRQSV